MKEFVCDKGHASHISFIQLLRSAMTVSQPERLFERKAESSAANEAYEEF